MGDLRRWVAAARSNPLASALRAQINGLLVALPLHVPEVYALHGRKVDVQGYVCRHTNRYSGPAQLIGRRVGIHEVKHEVRILSLYRLVCTHRAAEPGAGQRCTLAENHDGPFKKNGPAHPVLSPEETTLRAQVDEFAALVDALRGTHGGRALRPLRTLRRLFVD